MSDLKWMKEKACYEIELSIKAHDFVMEKYGDDGLYVLKEKIKTQADFARMLGLISIDDQNEYLKRIDCGIEA